MLGRVVWVPGILIRRLRLGVRKSHDSCGQSSRSSTHSGDRDGSEAERASTKKKWESCLCLVLGGWRALRGALAV